MLSVRIQKIWFCIVYFRMDLYSFQSVHHIIIIVIIVASPIQKVARHGHHYFMHLTSFISTKRSLIRVCINSSLGFPFAVFSITFYLERPDRISLFLYVRYIQFSSSYIVICAALYTLRLFIGWCFAIKSIRGIFSIRSYHTIFTASVLFFLQSVLIVQISAAYCIMDHTWHRNIRFFTYTYIFFHFLIFGHFFYIYKHLNIYYSNCCIFIYTRACVCERACFDLTHFIIFVLFVFIFILYIVFLFHLRILCICPTVSAINNNTSSSTYEMLFITCPLVRNSTWVLHYFLRIRLADHRRVLFPSIFHMF